MATNVVVIYSGGMDSFTLLHQIARQPDYNLHALSFNYGQKHVKELEFAQQVTQTLGISHQVIDIQSINALLQGSSLTTDIEIPEGHYNDETMKSTVVPNRNMILLSLAIGYAVSIDAPKVYYGAHSGDHAIYPDCRPEFVQKMTEVSLVANYLPVSIEVPFLHWDKSQILQAGLDMQLDYGQTWTCYNGREKACGKCGACVERLEAFANNQAQDPLAYEA
ncbi:MAG: 7-cyano-7-deazaguanine synthase QueC [Pseudomonadota bacterium]